MATDDLLTSCELLHAVIVVPDGDDMKYTDIFYTWASRHFYVRRQGHLDDAMLLEEKKAFCALAVKNKHAIKTLTPQPWPRHFETLIEHASSDRKYRAEMASMRRKLTRIRTAATGVLTRAPHLPPLHDVKLAATIEALTQED